MNDDMPPMTPQPAGYGGYAPLPPKKSAIGRRVLLVIVAVVVVASVAVATVFFLRQTGAPESAQQPSALVTLERSLQSAIGDTASLIAAANGPSLVVAPIADRVWVGLPEGSSLLRYATVRDTSAANSQDASRVSEVVRAAGLTLRQTTSNTATAYSDSAAMMQYLVSDELACNVVNLPQEQQKYYLTLTCALRADIELAYADTAPVIRAYAAGAQLEGDVRTGSVLIQDATVAGYKNAELYATTIDGATLPKATLYMAGAQGWQFFASADNQDDIACVDYATDDLKKAFTGFSCRLENGKSGFVGASHDVIVEEESTGPVTGG